MDAAGGVTMGLGRGRGATLPTTEVALPSGPSKCGINRHHTLPQNAKMLRLMPFFFKLKLMLPTTKTKHQK